MTPPSFCARFLHCPEQHGRDTAHAYAPVGLSAGAKLQAAQREECRHCRWAIPRAALLGGSCAELCVGDKVSQQSESCFTPSFLKDSSNKVNQLSETWRRRCSATFNRPNTETTKHCQCQLGLRKALTRTSCGRKSSCCRQNQLCSSVAIWQTAFGSSTHTVIPSV